MKAVFKTTGGKEPVREPATALNFSAGDVIFREGDLGTEMFIIQEGEVEISKKIRGETHVLSRLEKGDFFGEMAVMESSPRSADAIAHSEVKLLAINGSRFDEMIRKNPEIAVRIIRKYAKRLREANRLLDKLAGQSVDPDHATLDSVPETDRGTRHRLVDVATGTAFFFSKGDETLIGRSDPVTGILPDVDLTGVDTNRSVSRRHAKIVRTAEVFAVLEEVGTVNGTFVNDQRIPTGVPVPIQNGDRVRIGLVSMRVVFD
ncbi:MAG TPA: cyclic nucleotide-binding domain-containing protein [Thermoanaerobaculia bacterium]